MIECCATCLWGRMMFPTGDRVDLCVAIGGVELPMLMDPSQKKPLWCPGWTVDAPGSWDARLLYFEKRRPSAAAPEFCNETINETTQEELPL